MGKEVTLKFIQELISTIKPKSAKFLSQQARDIELFGTKSVDRMNVSNEMLETFTPFRRLSNKNCTLSDSKYFINKFEQEVGKDFLPTDWQIFSEAEKINYIVKERYSRLVANKIMKTIHKEPIEHSFQLDGQGEIVGYMQGDSGSVTDITALARNVCNKLGSHFDFLPKAKIDIHNHPDKRTLSAFSDNDIGHYISCNLKGYMVDSMGNRFVYMPKHNLNTGDAFMAMVDYIEKAKIYRKKIMDSFEQAYDKYMQAKNSGREICSELTEELIKWRDEMKILMDDKDLTYMNDILSSEAFSKYGQFKRL